MNDLLKKSIISEIIDQIKWFMQNNPEKLFQLISESIDLEKLQKKNRFHLPM